MMNGLRLAPLIGDALIRFEDFLYTSTWIGKEHDCVNLFVHGFVFPLISSQAAISEYTQVGIEVAVPFPPGSRSKPSGRRDVVIWNQGGDVAWNERLEPVNFPLGIMEWKARHRAMQETFNADDIAFLIEYSKFRPGFEGFAVTIDFASQSNRVNTAFIFRGETLQDFHRSITLPEMPTSP